MASREQLELIRQGLVARKKDTTRIDELIQSKQAESGIAETKAEQAVPIKEEAPKQPRLPRGGKRSGKR